MTRKKMRSAIGAVSEGKLVAFGAEHYMPVLKAKLGEISALKDLDDAARAGLTPLLEIIPRAWDDKKQKYKKSVAAHLKSQVKSVARAWGDRLFADGNLMLPGDELDSGGNHVLKVIHEEARVVG